MPVDPGYDTQGGGNPWDQYLADFFAGMQDLFAQFSGGGGSNPFNYKPFALKDIAIQEDQLQLQKKSGIQDIRNSMQGLRLQKQATLQDIRAARKDLQRQRMEGLRDIGQARQAGLENVRDDSLARGIFNSGIKTKNQNTVKREAGEARGDLLFDFRTGIKGVNQDAANFRKQFKLGMKGYKQDIGNMKDSIKLSMKRLANQRAEIKARPLSSGSSGYSTFSPSDIFNIVSQFGSYGVNTGSFTGGSSYSGSGSSGMYEPPPNLFQ